MTMPDNGFLPASQKAYDTTVWLLQRVERFPRKHRFSLGDRVETTSLDLCLALIEAAHSRGRQRVLHRASRLLDQLRLLVRLCCDLGLLSRRQHVYASQEFRALGQMIGGWIRAQTGASASGGRRAQAVAEASE